MNAGAAAHRTVSDGERAVALLRLMARFQLHPEDDAHPSWLPAAWPSTHRRPDAFGAAGRAVVGDLLRRAIPVDASLGGFDVDPSSPRKRLAMLDGASLRTVAVCLGFGAHRALLRQRSPASPAGRHLRRSLRRFGPACAGYVTDRMPELDALPMRVDVLERRPAAAPRIAMRRGARLLWAVLAPEGPAVLARARLKLPKRLALEPPPLTDAQRRQLDEVVQLSIVADRLAPWHWLF